MYETQTPPTLRSIVWRKVIKSVERATLHQTIKFFVQLIGAVCITILLVYPSLLLTCASFLFQVGNNALPKFTLVFGLIRYRKQLQRIYKRFQNKKTTYSIEGIPAVELLDHLFTTGSFKRDDIKRRFAIPHDRYQRLAKKLESLGILVRGEKNARILNEAYTRQDIAAILHNKRKASDLEEVLRPIGLPGEGNASYTMEPSMDRVQERVDEIINLPTGLPPTFAMKRVNG